MIGPDPKLIRLANALGEVREAAFDAPGRHETAKALRQMADLVEPTPEVWRPWSERHGHTGPGEANAECPCGWCQRYYHAN